MWRHTQGSSGEPASDLGWGSSSKTAPGLLSTGSPAGRTPPHGDGSMYSQAKCSAGSGMVREDGRGKTAHGWKGVRSGVRLKSRTVLSR